MDLTLKTLSTVWLGWHVPAMISWGMQLLLTGGLVAMLENLFRWGRRGWGWKICQAFLVAGSFGLRLIIGMFLEVSETDNGSGEWDDP